MSGSWSQFRRGAHLVQLISLNSICLRPQAMAALSSCNAASWAGAACTGLKQSGSPVQSFASLSQPPAHTARANNFDGEMLHTGAVSGSQGSQPTISTSFASNPALSALSTAIVSEDDDDNL